MRIRKLMPMFDADTGSNGESANSDMQDLDNMLDSLTASATETEGAADTSTTEPETQDEPEQKPKETTQTPNKQEFAFAQMRAQNTQLFGLLAKVAQATGVEFKDNNELLAKLNDDALGKIAKTQNVPVELLKRMEMLESTGKLYEAQQLQGKALSGFQKVKDTYGLTDDELRNFAAELDTGGKNPFLTAVDLETEYRLAHFQDIVKKETQKAVEAALKKSNAADRHSSTPSNAQGKPDTGNSAKITTVAGLDSLLNDMK